MTQGERENGPPDNWMHSIFFILNIQRFYYLYFFFAGGRAHVKKKWRKILTKRLLLLSAKCAKDNYCILTNCDNSLFYFHRLGRSSNFYDRDPFSWKISEWAVVHNSVEERPVLLFCRFFFFLNIFCTDWSRPAAAVCSSQQLFSCSILFASHQIYRLEVSAAAAAAAARRPVWRRESSIGNP